MGCPSEVFDTRSLADQPRILFLRPTNLDTGSAQCALLVLHRHGRQKQLFLLQVINPSNDPAVRARLSQFRDDIPIQLGYDVLKRHTYVPAGAAADTIASEGLWVSKSVASGG